MKDNILLLNAGSSSVKWKLFDINNEQEIAEGGIERINTPKSQVDLKFNGERYEEVIPNINYDDSIRLIFDDIEDKGITNINSIKAIGHRVVAGGQKFKKATKLDDNVIEDIKNLSDFAPLHNPNEVKFMKVVQEILPNINQYAVFDSSFFADMNEENAIYSIPYDLTKKYGIRRYSEHGISHNYLSKEAAKLLDKPLDELKLITLHLGGGASAAAIKYGKAYDSSMGFTPLAGLTMGTRSGDIDPSIVPLLMNKENMTKEEVINLLNNKSGVLGISNLSDDMRDIEAECDNNHQAKLAYDIFINRVVKYTGSFFTEMNRADAIVIAGGIGEHQYKIRYKILEKLSCLGVKIDKELNDKNYHGIISSKDSKIKVMIIPTNEELEMVRQIKEAM